MADVHYRWVPLTLWRRLALKDYWANRAPEKTCTPQSVIRALIEGITWEQRLLSEAAKGSHCQQFSTKSGSYGRLSHGGRRWGMPPLRSPPPFWITWAQAPHHPLIRMTTATEDRHPTSVCVEKQKRLQTFSCNAIKYLAFKLHLLISQPTKECVYAYG